MHIVFGILCQCVIWPPQWELSSSGKKIFITTSSFCYLLNSHENLLSSFVSTGISVSDGQRSRASDNVASEGKTTKFRHWYIQSASYWAVPSWDGSKEAAWSTRCSSCSAVSSAKTTWPECFPSMTFPIPHDTSSLDFLLVVTFYSVQCFVHSFGIGLSLKPMTDKR